MNAKEARLLSEESTTKMLRSSLLKIYTEIKNIAGGGNRHHQYQIDADHPCLKEIISSLKHDGYTVEHSQGYDQRDGAEWSFLNISWAFEGKIVIWW